MVKIDQFFGKVAVQKVHHVALEDTPPSKKKAAVKRSPVKVQAKPNSSSSSGLTAEEVLMTVPDADESYLVVDPALAGSNFFQLQAKKSEGAQPANDRAIPEGRPNCLNGLTIVFTGVLPSYDRAECERISSRYGAKVTKAISGKTSLVVIGREAGPKKIEMIKQKKIKCVDEDGFVELISRMPPDGGDGYDARLALAKKEEEARIAVEDALREEEEQKRKQAVQLEKRKTATKSSGVVPNKPSDRPDSDKLWTVRYAPTDMKQICGNKSNVEMLHNWLRDWFDNHKRGFNGSGINGFRAVMISGPPGIGKTTAAHLIAKSLGYDIIEKNASDVRSKKQLNDVLKSSLDNSSVVGFFNQQISGESNNRKMVLIMDEVDGMSSGDHGGGAQLSQFCKITDTPMILICNDKSLPKMRTFDKSCFDLTWRRPSSKEMKSRLLTIAHREGLKMDPNVIDQLASITHNDIRQIINIMSTVSRTQKSLDYSDTKNIEKSWQKEVILKPFDITGKLLSGALYGSNPSYNLNEKINLYFNDMDFTPLMIHENYRSVRPSRLNGVPQQRQNLAHLELLQKASDSISESDLVGQMIRGGEQHWSLAPFHAVSSSILPCSYIAGGMTGRTMFSSWLGQNSKKNKYDRILQELQYHSSTKTMTNNQELRLAYIPYFIKMLTKPIIEHGADGIEEVLKLMDEYYFTKEDWDNMMEFGVGKTGRMDTILKSIPTSVKTQFTRRYNSYTHPTIIYKTGDSVTKNTKSKAPRPDLEDYVDDDDDKPDENDDQEDDIKKDKLIQEVKPK
ncbi:hypothetical protein CANARDRAFT_185793, partial [[Candida] arabinofermentans NRRL YB-2248]